VNRWIAARVDSDSDRKPASHSGHRAVNHNERRNHRGPNVWSPSDCWKAVIVMSKPIEAEPSSTDGLLENYRRTAVHVLVSHQCVGTECSSCGQHWPCRAACAAEVALEL
jgi:hypothetical protein